jgi:hypothetical protein
MIKIRFLLCLTMALAFAAPASADSGNWRFCLGYAFLSQADEVKDTYKHLSREKGDGGDIYNTSINLRFQPYYQFANGWRTGAGVGPLIIFLGDSQHFQIPLNATLGYSFFKDSDFSVYCRAGVSYHAATGDYYAHSNPGWYGGLGMEFFNTRSTHIGFEAGWDGAKISLDSAVGLTNHKKIRTGELTLFLYADF